MPKNRFQASAVHLALSLAVALAAFLPIYFVWFPDVLFSSAGGRTLFLLIAGVDVGLGPLITLIIYKPGKPGLRFDLAVIAALQIAALAYGVGVLYEARPVYIVFAKDRFELVRANGIPEENLERAQAAGSPWAQLPLDGPKLVGARLPKDPDEAFRVMITGFGGVDIQSYPQHYVPYETIRAEAAARAQPLARLRELNPGRAAEIDRLIARLGRPESELAFLPMRAGKQDLAVLVDARSGEVLRLTTLKPWAP